MTLLKAVPSRAKQMLAGAPLESHDARNGHSTPVSRRVPGRTFCFVTSFPTGNEQGGWHGYRWQRRILIRTGGELGEDPAWLVVQGNRWRRRGQERQRLCLQSRRASDDRVRPRRQIPPLIW